MNKLNAKLIGVVSTILILMMAMSVNAAELTATVNHNTIKPTDGTSLNDQNGQGVNVYIVDTGIDDSHTLLSGHVVHAFDNMEDGLTRCGDHGTGIASIVGGESGVATGVMLHSVRVLDCSWMRDDPEVLEGLQWISENVQLPAVVNISIAGYDSTAYNAMVEELIAQGISVVTSAGNRNMHDACNVSPAGAEGVIAVGAVDVYDRVAFFNSKNEGNCIDTYALGVNVEVLHDNGETDILSGSSFAAAHVTGCITRYLQLNPTATPAQISGLIETASSSGILDCSFVDALSGGDTSLGFESGVELESVPLAVSVNQAAIHKSGIMSVFIMLLVSAMVVTTAVQCWERR